MSYAVVVTFNAHLATDHDARFNAAVAPWRAEKRGLKYRRIGS